MKRIALILGALVLFTNASSCQKAEKENKPQEMRLLRFEAGVPETKVYFGDVSEGHYPVLWKEGDDIQLFPLDAGLDAFANNGVVPVVPSADGKTAAFSVETSLSEGHNFSAMAPAAAYAGSYKNIIKSAVPQVQTPLPTSPDPKSFILMAYATIPSESTQPIKLDFSHWTAYGCLSLTGLSVTPKKVFISSKVEGGPNLTLITSSTKNIYFSTSPSFMGGKELTISVLSESGTVSKTITLPSDAVFQPGVVSRFSVDMSEATPSKVPIFDEDNIVFSFGAISDTHINSTTNAHAQKLVNALNQMKAKAAEKDPNGIDAIVVAGDLTDQPSSTGTQIGYFKQLYEQVFDPTKVPMIYTVGNHDANPSYWWTANTVAQAKVMQTGLGDNYFTFDLDQDNRKNFECRDCLIGGYHVLSVTPNSCNPVDYDLNVKTWLNNRLQAITEAEPEKFVIVNTHPMIDNTTYGSLLGTPTGKAISDIWDSGDTWATRKLDVLDNYPQVVTFGGHLHFPLNDPRSIWQAAFTSFGCGSTRYMAIENGKYEDMKSATVMNDCEQFSQGWLIQMDANGNMRATPMDFYNQAVIGEPYEISYPQADKSHLNRYGANRASSNMPPWLSSLEIVEKTLGTTRSYSAEWAAGFDDEFVHHYVLTLKKNGSVVSTRKYLADFYLHPQTSGMKKTWKAAFGTLSAGSYEATLTAYDSWDAASSPLSKAFTVEGGSAPVEIGIYSDLDFTNGQITDKKGKVDVSIRGNASVGKMAVSHKGKAYSVDALHAEADKYAVCQFNDILSGDEMTAFAKGGFSMETFYVDKAPGAGANAIHGVVCGTQSGGWGMATRATGVPYFIVGEDGYNTYKSVDASAPASTSELTHAVCVYDAAGKQLRIYMNGQLSAFSSISGSFFCGDGDTFNRFCLGADIAKGNVGTDFPCTDMVIVDAKIYTGAMDGDAALAAYNAAVAAL